ncbi:MAG: NAD-dependent dehydratase [Alphaproteobacteria bacterium]|nr:MAG: NAD-dependent dehydratase [Alphaproteobacteria bacterium]
MAHKDQIATVFGGTGFLGRQIVRELAARGVTVKIATRVPERAYSLKTCGAVGQIVPVLCDYSDAQSVRAVVKGSDFVINCIGILFERKKRATFEHVHVDIPAMIAKACADEKVSRFTHISALGCDTGISKYAQTKFDGENAVRTNFPAAMILRPAVMFGQDDDFFNKFAELARFMPFLPLIGGGKTRLQPVYVGDVADIVLKGLFSNSSRFQGKIYQLGGPDVVTFREIYEKLFKYTMRPKMLISMPFSVAKLEAVFLNILPNPILTPDQVESLKTDSIVDNEALGLDVFDISPKSMDLVLPGYLETYKSGGRFAVEQNG